jgi:antitoxin component of MazEF toxin-antitoxin module
MKKQIKRYGNSMVMVFNKDDIRFFNINVGDIFSVADENIQILKEKKEDVKENKIGKKVKRDDNI